MTEPHRDIPFLDQLQRRALIVGGAGAVLCAIAAVVDLDRFLQAYLTGFIYWWQITVGCLGLMMLHHVAGGRWGAITTRYYQAGARTVPLVALLFVPIALGASRLYIWLDESAVHGDHLLEHKQPYLNFNFWVIRAVIYFVIWWLLSLAVNRLSNSRDHRPAEAVSIGRKLRRIAAPGFILFGLSATFASFDWVMSLEPHWFSTIYGGIHAVGGMLAALALTVGCLTRIERQTPVIGPRLNPDLLNDLGNLLLAGVMLWTYFELSQFLIIWSGNLPDEAAWYLRRMEHGWGGLGPIIVVTHFVVPFLLLLSRDLKRRLVPLSRITCWILVAHYIDLIWVVTPAFDREPYRVGEFAIAPISWMELVTPLAIGGLWLFVYAGQLKRYPLLPVNDPAFTEDHPHGQAESAHV